MASSAPVVASCSALTRSHREILQQLAGNILFVWPEVAEDELAQRMETRRGHFMPASLLPSQLSVFEPPMADERHLRIDGSLPAAEQVKRVLRHLGRR